jgi:Tfp pilus assembly protein PilX
MTRVPVASQRGVALPSAMCLMLAVMSLGMCAARAALHAEKAARLERDRHVALLAADAALADAEADIAGGAVPLSERAAALRSGSAANFVAGCGRDGVQLGLCATAAPSRPPAWLVADLSGDAAVPFGQFTGAAMPSGNELLPARLPRYVIELVPFAAPGALYRITAIGFGTRASTRVVVQSYYRQPPGRPGKRVSWREVANWTELHEAAK